MLASLRLVIAAVAATAVLALSASAFAHQYAGSNGATVRLHVNPDDQPVAGMPAQLWIVSVRTPKGGRFSYSTCRCRVKVATATGEVLLNRRVSSSRTSFVFPESAAYQITVAGRYRARTGRMKSFSAVFGIRAS